MAKLELCEEIDDKSWEELRCNLIDREINTLNLRKRVKAKLLELDDDLHGMANPTPEPIIDKLTDYLVALILDEVRDGKR